MYNEYFFDGIIGYRYYIQLNLEIAHSKVNQISKPCFFAEHDLIFTTPKEGCLGRIDIDFSVQFKYLRQNNLCPEKHTNNTVCS